MAEALESIAHEASAAGNAESGRAAPRTAPVGRVDEARAARQLIPTFDARPVDGGGTSSRNGNPSPAASF